VVDTRNANGAFGGPMMGQGETRTYNIPAGPCAGIPSNASSYSLNFSVTGPAAQGYLTAWPAGATQPNVATMTWFAANQTLSNGAIVPASASGAISVFSAATTHVIIDINGYFSGAGGINISTYAYPNPQSGSYSLTIPSAGVSRILVEALGGGGGGAFSVGPPVQAGGNGGFARALIPVSPNTTLTLTIGAGGATGSFGSPNGTAGTDTTVAVNGGNTLLTAGGGGGGSSAFGGFAAGGIVTGPTATFIQMISGGNASSLGYVGGSGGFAGNNGAGGAGQAGLLTVTFVQ
jgi:hypothetical protein